jgi:hypothetical protein
VKLNTYLHLVLRSRIRGAIPPLLNTPSRHGAQLNSIWTTLPLNFNEYFNINIPSVSFCVTDRGGNKRKKK